MTILECPICYSHRASVLETHPPTARCADCGTVYKIKTENPLGSLAYDQPGVEPPKKNGKRKEKEITPATPIRDRDVGILTDFINDALQAGPEGLRNAYREASRFARKFGLIYLETTWFVCTPWLQQWAEGSIDTSANRHDGRVSGNSRSPFARSIPNRHGQSATRLRVRGAIKWRAVWLCHYAMSGSKALACRKAHVSEHTADYHLKNDEQFAAQAEAAKAHAIDLLHTRCFQRALEGDVEPVHWQGVVVDYVRKFDSRLQIEMLRAHMPRTFKTPGAAPINIDTGNKILAMDEATRAKLIEARRRALNDMPTTQQGEEARRKAIAEGQS